MKKIVFALVGLFILSQFIVSCGSENQILSQFSKKKYLKRVKKEKKLENINVGNTDFLVEKDRVNLDISNREFIINTEEIEELQKQDYNEISEEAIIALNINSNFEEYLKNDIIESNKILALPDTVYHMKDPNAPKEKQVHWTGYTAFITGLIGIAAGGIIFGIIGIYMTLSEKEKYKGIGWSILGLLFGIGWAIFILVATGF